MKMKECTSCETPKPYSEFQSWVSHGKIRYKSKCKPCEKQASVQRKEQNRPEYLEKHRLNQKTRRERNPGLTMLMNAKRRAKNMGLPFNLTLLDIIIPERCPVLGIKLKKGNKGFTDKSPSIDRIIPEFGYVPNNIRVISYRANSLKRDGTLKEFRRLIKYLKNPYEHILFR